MEKVKTIIADSINVKTDSLNNYYLKTQWFKNYAGIENDLFFQPKTSMLFGDAKKVLQELCAEVKKI